MSRYPTSAELAAFRRSIREAELFDTDDGMADTAYLEPPTYPTGRAWPEELRDGIGYRGRHDAPEYLLTAHDEPWDGRHIAVGSADADRIYATRARRGAAALRSRAYARACAAASPGPCADCGAIGWHTRACRGDWPALP